MVSKWKKRIFSIWNWRLVLEMPTLLERGFIIIYVGYLMDVVKFVFEDTGFSSLPFAV